jgi:hypothetical protein
MWNGITHKVQLASDPVWNKFDQCMSGNYLSVLLPLGSCLSCCCTMQLLPCHCLPECPYTVLLCIQHPAHCLICCYLSAASPRTTRPCCPQVTQGIYHHNVHGAGAAVAAGIAEPEDFRFFAQYAGWAPGQLEEECKSGVWFCTAASPSLTLNQELSNGGAMWHAILQVMGGEEPLQATRRQFEYCCDRTSTLCQGCSTVRSTSDLDAA